MRKRPRFLGCVPSPCLRASPERREPGQLRRCNVRCNARAFRRCMLHHHPCFWLKNGGRATLCIVLQRYFMRYQNIAKTAAGGAFEGGRPVEMRSNPARFRAPPSKSTFPVYCSVRRRKKSEIFQVNLSPQIFQKARTTFAWAADYKQTPQKRPFKTPVCTFRTSRKIYLSGQNRLI
jgi:hypothetical protein